MPRFVVRIGGRDFVVSSKNGIGAVLEFMREAVPVDARLHEAPPVIELCYADRPDVVDFLQRVESYAIPANVIWKMPTKEGEVRVVRPVAKAVKGPKAKALPGPKRAALPTPSPQLALGFGS